MAQLLQDSGGQHHIVGSDVGPGQKTDQMVAVVLAGAEGHHLAAQHVVLVDEFSEPCSTGAPDFGSLSTSSTATCGGPVHLSDAGTAPLVCRRQ
jgi:hypothetical protein